MGIDKIPANSIKNPDKLGKYANAIINTKADMIHKIKAKHQEVIFFMNVNSF